MIHSLGYTFTHPRMWFALTTILLLALAVGCKNSTPVEVEVEEVILTTNAGIQFVRTPEDRFTGLPDFPYEAKYVEIDGLRQAFVEDGPVEGDVVLLLHGQPSWSYLYRKMIPVLADAGHRVIAMDHLGMGRSDKPIDIESYSYLGHCNRLERFIEGLGLSDINLFVQDWGSIIGLRVAGLNPEWFATISVGNGMLPVIPAGTEVFPTVEDPDSLLDIPSPFASIPDQQFPFYDGCNRIGGPGDISYFGDWMIYAMKAASFHPAEVLEAQTWFPMPSDVEAAYDAPFPSREYMAGIRTFPSLINEVPGETEAAYAGLTSFEKPFLTIWAANDPGAQGSCEIQQSWIDNVPGAIGKPHARLGEASHFLQDDQGEEIARRLVEFYRGNYTGGNFGVVGEDSVAKVGFEIMQIKSAQQIITWKNLSSMTVEEFKAIELPHGWFKNQPREGDADGGVFARSPDAAADGVYDDKELFGYKWRHVATVIETGIKLDNQELLSGNRIRKYHTLTFNTGRTLNILTSPEGDRYVRVSRDYGRSSAVPTIPDSWNLGQEVISEEIDIQLPNPTLNIRAENEDSFQGPVVF